jgi:hypothetical protein
MATENLLIHNCCHWEAVKAIRKRFPELDIIPPLTYKQLLQLHTKTATCQAMKAQMTHMRRETQT